MDTVEIKIPTGYAPESIFHDIKIESKFGTYTAVVKVSADNVQYTRKQVNFSGKFPATDYAALSDYYEQIYKADHKQLVFTKQE